MDYNSQYPRQSRLAQWDDRSGSINLRDFGAACDGVEDDYAALTGAVTYIKTLPKGAELIIPGPTKIGGDIVIPQLVGAEISRKAEC